MNLIFLTASKIKLKEIKHILGKNYNIFSARVIFPELRSIDVEDVVRQKVKHAYDIVKKPVFTESTGLYIKIAPGKYFPGSLTKFYVRALGNKNITKIHGGKIAHAITSIAYHDGKKIHVFVGKICGSISTKPRGTKGVGWDPIFIPTSIKYNKKKLTFGELGEQIKNKISMRKIAVMKFISFLEEEEEELNLA